MLQSLKGEGDEERRADAGKGETFDGNAKKGLSERRGEEGIL